jgi:hypothetical protein
MERLEKKALGWDHSRGVSSNHATTEAAVRVEPGVRRVRTVPGREAAMAALPARNPVARGSGGKYIEEGEGVRDRLSARGCASRHPPLAAVSAGPERLCH